jgi:hypothetical protein
MPGVFERHVTVAIGQAGVAGVALSKLRIAFLVNMNRGSNPHTASIRIWNPNPLTLALLEGPLPTVGLKVGYGDAQIPGGGVVIERSIFLGEVVKNGLQVEREGRDRIATIDASDTPSAYQSIRIALTFPTSITMSAVVASIAGHLLLPIGSIVVAPDVVLTQGGVFSGSARDILDRIAQSTNSDWWISDGVFFFGPKGAPVPSVAPVFSSLNGNLIGTPIKKDRGSIEVKALLDASMRPGSSFVVSSRSINGTYVASDVEFVGDSGYDTPFYVRITGKLPGQNGGRRGVGGARRACRFRDL